MKRFKAFTIAELIVVMVISTIVLATIYTTYLLIRKQYAKQSGRIGQLNEYLLFKNAFSKDFRIADSVVLAGDINGLQCFLGGRKIEYAFTDSAIVRTEEPATDTFKLTVEGFETNSLEAGAFVEQVSLKIIPYRDTVVLKFHKNYDALFLIQH